MRARPSCMANRRMRPRTRRYLRSGSGILNCLRKSRVVRGDTLSSQDFCGHGNAEGGASRHSPEQRRDHEVNEEVRPSQS